MLRLLALLPALSVWLATVHCSPVPGEAVAKQLTLAERSSSKFSSVLVFGDSLSDNGNGSWRLTNYTWPADPAYYQGRFSNGPVWPERLTSLVGAKQLLDYAYGGATINNTVAQGYTGANSTIPVPSVIDQISSFLNSSVAVTEPCSSLVILLAGLNDAFFAGASVNARALTDSLVNGVAALASKGFRDFVLPKTQGGAFLPYTLLYSPAGAAASQEQFSKAFNGNLTLSIKAAKLPHDVKLHLWDERGAFEKTVKKARAQGFEAGKPCLQGAYGEEPTRTLCEDPDRYVFFDIFHPTKVTHLAIAKDVAALLAQ